MASEAAAPAAAAVIVAAVEVKTGDGMEGISTGIGEPNAFIGAAGGSSAAAVEVAAAVVSRGMEGGRRIQ
jgi:hypothetical protein